VATGLLEQLLSRGVQPGGKDHASDTPDVIPPGEPAGEPGQPVAVRFFVVVEEGDDLAIRGGRPGVAGPGQSALSLEDVVAGGPAFA
jgi:hypothetical protein